eukprot:946170-Amphidinium_carterae.2
MLKQDVQPLPDSPEQPKRQHCHEDRGPQPVQNQTMQLGHRFGSCACSLQRTLISKCRKRLRMNSLLLGSSECLQMSLLRHPDTELRISPSPHRDQKWDFNLVQPCCCLRSHFGSKFRCIQFDCQPAMACQQRNVNQLIYQLKAFGPECTEG